MFPLFIFSGAFSALFLSIDKYLVQSGQKLIVITKGERGKEGMEGETERDRDRERS